MQTIPIITRKIKKSVKYRNLGGQNIVIDRELNKDDVKHAENWACYNFMDRRKDFNNYFLKRCFYGHAEDGLGYVVCEDELESEVPKLEGNSYSV